MKKRLKNKFFIAAIASFIYQILVYYKVAPDFGIYKIGVDLVSYIFIGTGIYSTFSDKNE